MDKILSENGWGAASFTTSKSISTVFLTMYGCVFVNFNTWCFISIIYYLDFFQVLDINYENVDSSLFRYALNVYFFNN